MGKKETPLITNSLAITPAGKNRLSACTFSNLG
jgi:hypothetical protein